VFATMSLGSSFSVGLLQQIVHEDLLLLLRLIEGDVRNRQRTRRREYFEVKEVIGGDRFASSESD